MVTEVFVAKVNRIINDKKNNYCIHRINIPANVVEKLNLGKEEFLLFKAKKAEWYDMLDWSEMKVTWDKLPQEIKQKISEDGIFDGTEKFRTRKQEETPITSYTVTPMTEFPMSPTSSQIESKRLLGYE